VLTILRLTVIITCKAQAESNQKAEDESEEQDLLQHGRSVASGEFRIKPHHAKIASLSDKKGNVIFFSFYKEKKLPHLVFTFLISAKDSYVGNPNLTFSLNSNLIHNLSLSSYFSENFFTSIMSRRVPKFLEILVYPIHPPPPYEPDDSHLRFCAYETSSLEEI